MGRKLKEEGIYIYTWLRHFAAQQKLPQWCKATSPNKKRRLIKREGWPPLGTKFWTLGCRRALQGNVTPFHFRGEAEAEAETALSPSFSL